MSKKKKRSAYTPPRVRPLKLVMETDPKLRTVALAEIPDECWADLGRRLVATAAKHAGYAVAAPQVGADVRLVGMHPDVDVVGKALAGRALLNPTIVDNGGSEVRHEGCLSLPGRWWAVPRFTRVTVTAVDPLDGTPFAFDETDAWLARMWQHEVDHLDGLLIDDGRYEEVTDFVNRRARRG